MNLKQTAIIAALASLLTTACSAPTPTPMDGTVTVQNCRWKPPSGWPTFATENTVVVVSAGDAEVTARDWGQRPAGEIIIRLSIQLHLDGATAAEFASNLWRTENWVTGGGNAVAPWQEWPLPQVAPVTVGALSGVQTDSIERSVILRRYMLDLSPEKALYVAVWIPPGHAGLAAALESLETLERLPLTSRGPGVGTIR